jgi:hypothetical protein
MKVFCDDNSTVGIVDSPVSGAWGNPYATLSVYDNPPDQDSLGESYGVLKISLDTASDPRRIYSILHSFEMAPDSKKVLELVQETDPSATWVIVGKE